MIIMNTKCPSCTESIGNRQDISVWECSRYWFKSNFGLID